MKTDYDKIEDAGRPGFRHTFGGIGGNKQEEVGAFIFFCHRELGRVITVEEVQPNDSDTWELEIRGSERP